MKESGVDAAAWRLPGLSRRDFLKHSGLLVCATALGPALHASRRSSAAGIPLRRYADRIVRPSGKPFKIGIQLESGDWSDPTGIPEQEAAQQFNHLVNHGIVMGASYVGPGQWDFSGADWIAEKARAANQSMIGMHLVWGSVALSGVPRWIVNGGYSRNQLIRILEDHIAAVMTRYRGIIGAYTVVNERLNGGGNSDWWYENIGLDYLEIAFRKARQLDPDAVLIYNHYDNHTKDSPHYTITKVDVDHLRAQDLVDAVGLQLHLWSGRPAKADVSDAMTSYGLPIWVTEFDCCQYPPGAVDDPEEEQASITKDMIQAALESSVCDCFTNWGFSDRNSWWGEGYKPCLWDADNNPKLNYSAIQRALMQVAPPWHSAFLPLVAK